MDSSQSLAIESFSYSWLANVNSSMEGLEVPLRSSIDSCYEVTFYNNKVKSRRSLEEAQINFNFDVPISQSSADGLIAHADQLFSDGLIKPGCVNQSKMESFNSLALAPAILPSSSKSIVPAGNIHLKLSFGRWRRLSKRILLNFLGYLRTFGLKGSRSTSRKSKRVDDIDRRTWEVKSCSSSPQASPRQITLHSANDWADIERSIYEAVLHCKRSIDK